VKLEKFVAPFLLGIDVGTTGCKTELMDVEGNTAAKAYREYSLIFPKVSWVEHDSETGWWKATVDTIQEVLNNSKVDPKDIKGISISCTNALVAVDREGNPLRPAIMQFDKRTIDQVKRIKEKVGEDIIKITGNQPSASGTSAPIILWMKENEPEIFKNTYKFLWPGGFVVHKLTNQFTMEWSRASWTCLFETGGKQRWSEKLCDDLEIPMEKLPPLVPSWQIVGEITEKAAKITGLAKGTPVVGGMADTPAAGIGTGAVAPGRTCHIIGTTARPCIVLDKPKFDARFINCCHAVPNCWFSLGAIENAGLAIKWFRDLFGQQEVSLAQLTNRNAFEYLDNEAQQSPPGANGIIFLPYLAGERSPLWDPYARGVLFGLSVSHTRADVIRAILEGVAFTFVHNLEIFEGDLGMKMDEVFLSGGGAKSLIWPQIHADVSGKKVKVPKVKESEAIGNSILAGFGVGIYKDMVDAADRVVKVEKVVEPRREYFERYQAIFRIYKDLYLHLKEDFVNSAQVK
jgi:xylulokinase